LLAKYYILAVPLTFVPVPLSNCWDLKNKTKLIFICSLIPIRDPSILAECGLDENTKDVLLNNIKRKLTSQAVKIRADIEVACYGYEGIDAVKTALRAGLACSTEELPIKINLIAPPLYGNLLYRMLLFQPHWFVFRFHT
jgi:hypothetical protein